MQEKAFAYCTPNKEVLPDEVATAGVKATRITTAFMFISVYLLSSSSNVIIGYGKFFPL
jgi:hypothetical protein